MPSSTLKQRLNNLVAAALPYCMAPLWLLGFFYTLLAPTTTARKVLLVSRNAIAADHMIEIARLLADEEDIQLTVTADRFPSRGFTSADASNIVRIPGIHIFKALSRHWDLIVFTNHPYGLGVCFPPWTKKLYVNHGIHTGKINNEHGEDGVYGRSKVLRPFGAPYYDRMFAASNWEKEFALTQTPELADAIVVTGFLRADNFLESAPRARDEAIKRLSLDTEKKIVHVISTWGPQSLYSQHGKAFLQQMAELRPGYEFLVSIHPRFDEIENNGSERRVEILRRFKDAGAIVNQDLDWQDYVIAADLAISDHSSLCLYHLLLQHPIVFVPVAKSQFVSGSTFDRLQSSMPQPSTPFDFGAALDAVVNETPSRDLQQILDTLLDKRGAARQYYLKEIHNLLNT